MKKLEINSDIGNDFFWLYYISTSFPNAMDELTDTPLSEYMYDSYEELSDEDCEKWIDELTQFTEDAIDENDGHIDDPNTLELSLNGSSFKIEFHPCATVYILNGEEIGSAEGEYKLRTLSWEKFKQLIQGCTDPRLPLLILPVLALEKPMIPEAEKIIRSGLEQTCLKKEDIGDITEMIINGLL